MILSRSIRTAPGFFSKRILIRGTASYEFRGLVDGPNAGLLQHLIQEMQREEVAPGRNPFKVRAMATAIKTIHELDYPIKDPSHIKEIPGVGEGIARRITEFLGKTRKRDYLVLNEEDRKEIARNEAMQQLQRVNGIGPIKARALVEQGCMSLEQLNEPQYLELLPQAARTSFQYLSAMQQRVTRQQAEVCMTMLRERLTSDFELHLVGSYRRGHQDMSDIDILLFNLTYTTPPLLNFIRGSERNAEVKSAHVGSHARPPPNLMGDAVIAPLRESGLIASALSAGPSKWQGIVKIQQNDNELLRRLDINLMPLTSKAAALLAFTGDKEFNRVCRKRAARDHMHLNEFGLWRQKLRDVDPAVNDLDFEVVDAKERRCSIDSVREDQPPWEFVETPDEAALLRELGMGYVIPERRNFGNVGMNQRSDRNRAKGGERRQGYSSSETSRANGSHKAMFRTDGRAPRSQQHSRPSNSATEPPLRR